MRIPLFLTLTAIAFAQAPDQDVDRLLTISGTHTTQDLQEIATSVRTIAVIPNLAINTEQTALVLRAPAPNIALGTWLFQDLDKTSSGPSTHEYKVPGAADDIVRIFRLNPSFSAQEFQEVATTVRTIGNIRLVFTENAQHAAVMRGTAEQMDLAAWLLKELDGTGSARLSSYPVALHNSNSHEDDSAVRIFRIANSASAQDFQEVSTLVRTISNTRSVFTINELKSVAMRGSPEAMTMADWLFAELDKSAAPRPQPAEYRVPGANDDVVKVFYVPNAPTIQAFQQTATAMRTASNIRVVFTYNSRKAVAMRGTSNQLATAEHAIP